MFNDLFEYDENGWNEVIPANSPPPPRRDAVAWAEGCDLMVQGGYGYGEHGTLNDLWRFFNSTNRWEQVPITGTQPSPRSGHTVTHLPDGSTLLLGGVDSEGHELADFWKYTPAGFQQLPGSPVLCSYHSAHYMGTTFGDLLLTFCVDELLGMYSFDSNAWNLTSLENCNWPTHSASVKAQNAAGQEVIFFFGGENGLGEETDTILEFNLATGECTQRAQRMPYPVKDHAAARLNDTSGPSAQAAASGNLRVLIFGGISNGEVLSNTLTLDIFIGQRTYLPLVLR